MLLGSPEFTVISIIGVCLPVAMDAAIGESVSEDTAGCGSTERFRPLAATYTVAGDVARVDEDIGGGGGGGFGAIWRYVVVVVVVVVMDSMESERRDNSSDSEEISGIAMSEDRAAVRMITGGGTC